MSEIATIGTPSLNQSQATVGSLILINNRAAASVGSLILINNRAADSVTGQCRRQISLSFKYLRDDPPD
jgi:hypothetical protein